MISFPSPSEYRITAEKNGLIHAVYGDWTVFCASDRRAYLDLLPQLTTPNGVAVLQEFKKSYRDLVALIQPREEKIIFKLSRRERFILQKHLLTLFRDSEAVSTLKSATRLRRQGLREIYRPFMALEKRRWNMVQETILLYDFVEGPDCLEVGESSYPLVVAALKKCHEMGCRHADAQPKNFIVQEGRVCMIDSRFKRNVMGRFGEFCDFITLEDNLPAIRKYLDYSKCNLPYLAAKTYRVIKQNKKVRRFKQSLRAKRSRRYEAQQTANP